tara:strand:+ start:40 stop:573 length:534 start_codon:yes stop_codon:yes gene_type:complete
MAPPNKIKFTKEEIKERARKVGALKGAQQVRKKAKKAQVKKFQKTSKSYPTEGDRDFRSGFTKSGEETQKLGRKPKVAPSDKPLRGSGNYMSQSDKDMNAAKKKGDVKEQTRLKNVQKSIEANKKAAKLKGVGGGGNRGRGKPIELQEKLLVRKSALKKNKGGAIMKKRGGMFKGSY